jgi:transporter family-2 protein
MQVLYIAMALLAGFTMPTQAGINLQLTDWTKNAVTSAFISFFVGTLVLLGYLVATQAQRPDMGQISSLKWWHWSGGFFGAYIVSMSIFLAPKLGATTMMALFMAGQMFLSIIFDHYGVLGFPVQQASPLRILGALLLVVGVVLIRKY